MSRSFRALPQKPTGPKPPRRGFLAAVSALALAPAGAAAAPTLRRLHVTVRSDVPLSDVEMTAEEIAAARARHLDADLIRLCEAHPAIIRRAEEDSTYEDDCPLWLAYERSRDAIGAAVPVTLAGMVAKARAAKAEARNSNGTESPSNCPAENWAWDLVNDLLRLEGGA